MKTFSKLFNISLILIIFCKFGSTYNKVEADSRFLKNAAIIQQSLQQLKIQFDKTAETCRSLQQEKVRLVESCERLQLKIHELTNLTSCINNCAATTAFSSVKTTIATYSSTIEASESPTTTQPKTTTTVSPQCQSNPCQNHGICQPDGPGYVCLCALGYVGVNCENSDCYQQYHPDGGFFIISSPGYSSGTYPNLWSCTFNNFTFGLNDGDNKLWLNFLQEFSLEDQDLSICSPVDGCCDYVTVYDGPDTTSPLIGRYCGRSLPPPIYSTSSSLTVEFHSDMSTKGRGFAATVGRAIPNDTCGDDLCTNNQFCYQEGYALSCKSPCDLSPCLNLATCVNVNASSFSCTCQQYNTGPRCGEVNHAVLVDCQYAPLLYTGTKRSGLYTVYPDGVTPVEVYCETIGPDTWTVIMNHVDDMDFNRTWSEYVNGFGYANGSHWVGLDNIYKFVHGKRYSLRIDMTDCEGNTVLSEYELFDISNGDDNYTLSIAGYDADQINGYDNGNDAVSPFNYSTVFNQIGQPFSTFDKDNTGGMNCGAVYGSGWWWGQCYSLMANPMGKWYPNCKAEMPNGGIQWNTWKNSSYSLYRTSMKLLRQHY